MCLIVYSIHSTHRQSLNWGKGELEKGGFYRKSPIPDDEEIRRVSYY